LSNSYNNFQKLADALPRVLSQAVKKTALDVQAAAQQKAPVDTGFLKASIYTVTSERSTYKPDAKALPAVDKPENDQTAYVAVGAAYGAYVEFGVRHAPAQPYFYPALEEGKKSFDQAVAAIEKKVKEASGS